MRQQSTSGIHFLLSGLKLLVKKELRWFVITPLIINIVVFSYLTSTISGYFSGWIASMVAWLPSWLSFLEWLAWPLLAISMVAIIFFTFTIVGNLIASPFNTLLAERVQIMEGEVMPNFTTKDWLMLAPKSIARELNKLAYYLPRAFLLLLLSFIPLVGTVLWFLFNGWMAAIQYCDYAADNSGVSLRDVKRCTRNQLSTAWPFGMAVNMMMLIPFLNLLIIPAAVAGATLMWQRSLRQQLSVL